MLFQITWQPNLTRNQLIKMGFVSFGSSPLNRSRGFTMPYEHANASTETKQNRITCSSGCSDLSTDPVQSPNAILVACDPNTLLIAQSALQPTFNLIGAFSDIDSFLSSAKFDAVDIIFTDTWLRESQPALPIAMLMHEVAKHGISSGLSVEIGGCRLALEALISLVNIVQLWRHQQVKSGAPASDSPPVAVNADQHDAITDRERSVLTLLVHGMSMKEAASCLHISPRTIAFHKYNVMRRLSLRGNSDLVEFATRNGLLSIHPPLGERTRLPPLQMPHASQSHL